MAEFWGEKFNHVTSGIKDLSVMFASLYDLNMRSSVIGMLIVASLYDSLIQDSDDA
jgi:hypothetical protein